MAVTELSMPWKETKGAEVTINGKKQNVKSSPRELPDLVAAVERWRQDRGPPANEPPPPPGAGQEGPGNRHVWAVGIGWRTGQQRYVAALRELPLALSHRRRASYRRGPRDHRLPRSRGETLRFKTVGVGKPNDVTLIPLADLHHQRYTVYWETMAPGDWKPAPSLKPEKIAASKLTAGLDYKYFEGNWKMLPDFGKLEAKKTGVVEDIGLSIQDQRDNFGVVFSGYLKIAEKGEYLFSIRSDDGTRVSLAGKEIILNDGVHDMIPAPSQPVLLAAGFYPLEVEYFEAAGGEGIEINTYSPADGTWRRIPKTMLYRRK